MIEKQEILKIMELSKLKIEDDKIDKFGKDFSLILDYVSDLKKLETGDIEEMSYSIDIKNVERDDVPLKYEGINLISKSKEAYLVVKKNIRK